jgi:Ca2+-binding EF-hand superfamily protein
LGVLKVNEPTLLAKGKDDDIWVAVLKDFFTRMGLSDSEVVTDPKQQDISVMTGKPLYDLLMNVACNVLGPLITNEAIESMRVQHRLKVVHQMEDTNRKSQIRTLCEQVTFTFDEIGIVYDEVRNLEFLNDEWKEDPNTGLAKLRNEYQVAEDLLKNSVVNCGGWGLVSKKSKHSKSESLQKTISLMDFEKVLKLVSPFRHDSHNHSAFKPVIPSPDSELSLGIVERIYFYCSFQYHYAQRQKKIPNPAFIVDLAAMIQALDTIMKQPLHTRLRFLFDLHDIDGDSFLNNNELKQAMDSLLEMFQKSHQGNRHQAEKEEETYLKAVSSFLSAALQMGNNKTSEYNSKPPQSITEESINLVDLDSTLSDKIKPSKKIVEDEYRLSFNEFLLAILSQSVFVEYFERKWTLKKDADVISVSWQV